MARVERRPAESFDSLLKRFRKSVTQARILSEVRKRRFFVPESEKRRIAQKKAIRKHRRRQRQRDWQYAR